MERSAAPGLLRLSLDRSESERLLDKVAAVLAEASFYRAVMPRWGTPFSVEMSNCGELGWVSDKAGYRYQRTHPVTGKPWPAMPDMFKDIWFSATDYLHPPEACLINYYAASAKMGLHQDKDEEDFSAPVVSVSLGDSARFRLGGMTRDAPTLTQMLHSGDVMSLTGDTRLAYHGIDKVLGGSSTLLERHPVLFPGGGRLNLTLRRVTIPV